MGNLLSELSASEVANEISEVRETQTYDFHHTQQAIIDNDLNGATLMKMTQEQQITCFQTIGISNIIHQKQILDHFIKIFGQRDSLSPKKRSMTDQTTTISTTTSSTSFKISRTSTCSPQENEIISKKQPSSSSSRPTLIDRLYQEIRCGNHQSLNELQSLCDEGELLAKCFMVIIHFSGVILTKNEEKAKEMMKENDEELLIYLRNNSNQFTEFILGWCFYNGVGVPQNDFESVSLYRRSADHGYSLAQFNLGVCYQIGRGVGIDHNEVISLYRRAANQGHSVAQFNLGVCCQFGRGVPIDLNEAISWYRKSSNQGNAHSQNNLALCYQRGRGVPIDLNEAISLFRKSANQGLSEAQFNLTRCYQYGQGVQIDHSEAILFYQKAKVQSHANAQRNLAFYEEGVSIEVISRNQKSTKRR